MMKYKPYLEYKDSGIEWIGEIPKKWEVKKLKYLTTMESGSSITVYSLNEDDEFPVYGGNGLRGYTSDYTHDGVYILIGRQGALCGNVHIARGKFWASEHAVVVTLKQDSDIIWLYSLLLSMNLNQYTESAAQPGISVYRILNLHIPLPPISQQTAIAKFIDSETTRISGIIKAKTKLIEKLKEKRIAIISHAVTKGLDPDVKLKPSGIEWIGDIPDGWEIKKLKYIVAKAGSGVTPTGGATVYQDEGIPLIRSQNVYSDGLKLEEIVYISDEIDEQMSNSRIKEGDVLLNITGASIGRCYYVPVGFGCGNVNQHVCIIRPTDNKVKTKFMQSVIISEYGQQLIDVCQIGANREGLNFQNIKSFVIPLPPLDQQAAIADYLDVETARIDSIIAKNQASIEKLNEYQTALISAAVTGKIDVRGEYNG